MNTKQFQSLIWNHYKKHKRLLPWRKNITPYKILVSEVMLQQTQVSRVIPKYGLFLKLFPNIDVLAKANLAEVLKAWQGLGYYRRAKNLKKAAEIIVKAYGGKIPPSPRELEKLPGIGPNTAGSIVVYAFNQSAVFIETNIRKIFLHHFFKGRKNIPDSQLLPLIEKTLPKRRAREWYWALMDYGVYLSKAMENPNRRSKHYSRQSKFEGSLRQLRGKILKILLENGQMAVSKLEKQIADKRFSAAVNELSAEGFIQLKKGKIFIQA